MRVETNKLTTAERTSVIRNSETKLRSAMMDLLALMRSEQYNPDSYQRWQIMSDSQAYNRLLVRVLS